MTDNNKKMAELIDMHLELKAKSGQSFVVMDQEDFEVPEEGTLPPRSTLFPTKRRKWTRLFYNTLFVLFVLLVVSLTVWGFKLNE